MAVFELIPVYEKDVEEMCALAAQIWTEHFTPLLAPGQVAYMLGKFQSVNAVSEQLKSGYEYFFIADGGQKAGYSGIKLDNGAMFLSKLYIKREYRGRGLARKTVERYVHLCRERGATKIWLTVNRHNALPIAVYKKLGFVTVREQATDIGEGYVMDDYIMEMPVEC